MLRGALVLVAAVMIAGCATSGCHVVAPGQASANFLWHAAGTETDLRAMLDAEGWTNLTAHQNAPDIFLEGERQAGNQTIHIIASASTYRNARADEPITGISLTASAANVTSDDAARAMLSPFVDALAARAPPAWGSPDEPSYSGGAKLCVD